MSREELVDALCAQFCISSNFKIEPDEQERIVKWLVPEIECLLAAEREKVREMCARAMCFRCAEGNKPFNTGSTIWLHALRKKLDNSTTEHWNEACAADAIRQLDLTAPDNKEAK